MKNPLPCGCNNKGKPLSTDHFYLIDSCEPAYSTSLYFATNELLPYQSFASNCRVCIFPPEGDPNSFPSKPAELFQSIEESTESGFCCRDFYRKQRDWLKLKQDSENLEMNKYSIFVWLFFLRLKSFLSLCWRTQFRRSSSTGKLSILSTLRSSDSVSSRKFS